MEYIVKPTTPAKGSGCPSKCWEVYYIIANCPTLYTPPNPN
jgi:hypothetical protein